MALLFLGILLSSHYCFSTETSTIFLEPIEVMLPGNAQYLTARILKTKKAVAGRVDVSYWIDFSGSKDPELGQAELTPEEAIKLQTVSKIFPSGELAVGERGDSKKTETGSLVRLGAPSYHIETKGIGVIGHFRELEAEQEITGSQRPYQFTEWTFETINQKLVYRPKKVEPRLSKDGANTAIEQYETRAFFLMHDKKIVPVAVLSMNDRETVIVDPRDWARINDPTGLKRQETFRSITIPTTALRVSSQSKDKRQSNAELIALGEAFPELTGKGVEYSSLIGTLRVSPGISFSTLIRQMRDADPSSKTVLLSDPCSRERRKIANP